MASCATQCKLSVAERVPVVRSRLKHESCTHLIANRRHRKGLSEIKTKSHRCQTTRCKFPYQHSEQIADWISCPYPSQPLPSTPFSSAKYKRFMESTRARRHCSCTVQTFQQSFHCQTVWMTTRKQPPPPLPPTPYSSIKLEPSRCGKTHIKCGRSCCTLLCD